MKNIVVKIAAVTSVLACATIAIAADDPAELQRVRERVTSLFGEIEEEHIFPSPVDGWYTIRKGAMVVYISADGRYLLQGDMIDLDNQINLSENARNDARSDMMSAYPEDQMIVFTPDEKRYSVSVFTDVDCTFCRRLHSQIDEYLAQGIEIRYLLYPRNGPTSESWTKAEQVWCADDRNAALTQAKLDKKFPSHDCDPSVVSKHYAMGQDVGLRGTPAIVFEDGTLVSGYMPPLQLAEALAENAAGQ
ncbi:MAG: DsbC family protein [Proteobacteria bacterium]|nr:DsbC family protein [Pseudomonadota bacterium]